jgi:hypothetical protein
MATQDEIQSRVAELNSLREQIAAADTDRRTREMEAADAITMAQLDAEKARLQSQLTQAEALASATGIEGSASTLLANLEQQASSVNAPVEAQPEPTPPAQDTTEG